MTTPYEEFSATYDAIAKRAADEWKSVYLAGMALGEGSKYFDDMMVERIKVRADNAVLGKLEQMVLHKLSEFTDSEIDKYAYPLLEKWMLDKQVAFNEPTKKIKAAIERAFEDLDSRSWVFENAARKQMVEALALHEEGVPLLEISKQVIAKKSTVKKWIDLAQKELAELKQTLAIYGYEAVKKKAPQPQPETQA